VIMNVVAIIFPGYLLLSVEEMMLSTVTTGNIKENPD